MQQHIYPTELIVQYAYIPILCWQMCRNTSSSMSTDIFSRKQNVWNTSCHTWLSWEWMICFSSVIFSGGRDILRNLSRWNLSASTLHIGLFSPLHACAITWSRCFYFKSGSSSEWRRKYSQNCKSEDEKLYFITFQRNSL